MKRILCPELPRKTSLQSRDQRKEVPHRVFSASYQPIPTKPKSPIRTRGGVRGSQSFRYQVVLRQLRQTSGGLPLCNPTLISTKLGPFQISSKDALFRFP